MSLGTRKKYFAESHKTEVDEPMASEVTVGGDNVTGPRDMKRSLSASLSSLHNVQEKKKERERERIPITSLYGTTGTSTHPVSTRRMQSKDMDRSSYQYNKVTPSMPSFTAAEPEQGTPTPHHHSSEFDKSSSTGNSGREISGFAIGTPLFQSRAAAGLMRPTSSASAVATPRSVASGDLLNSETPAKVLEILHPTYADDKTGRGVSVEDRGMSTVGIKSTEDCGYGK